MRSKLCLAVALCLSGLSLGGAAKGDADAAQAIVNVPDPQNSPGCAAAIVKDGKTLTVKTSGAADIITHRQLDPDTLFYAASVSKQFTVLLIATLVSEGKLTLDDDIRKWIPELP